VGEQIKKADDIPGGEGWGQRYDRHLLLLVEKDWENSHHVDFSTKRGSARGNKSPNGGV